MAFATIVVISALTPASGAEGPRSGLLSVRESFDQSEDIPIEGYVSYLVIRKAGSGKVVIKESKPGFFRSTSVLPLGNFRLRSFVRDCEGNCGYLSPPSSSCSAAFTMRAGESLKAKIRRDASQCRVVIDAS
jgi:hypothetical protein